MPAQTDGALSLSWDGLIALCRHLALHVRSTYDPDVVVGIARVGILPATLIALLLRRDVQSLRVPVPDLPATLPPHLPSPEVIEGRRVLLVDEVATSGQTLRRAAEALLHLGAREVRTLVLFATPHGAQADYSGPEATVMVLQPWIREVAVLDAEITRGGYAQMLPMEQINLHLTGDIHAVETAQNLCAAAIDSSILLGNPLHIDPWNVTWPRCVDVNDRALRDVVIGLGGRANGYPRQTGYAITAATETAAIHSLAQSLRDLRERFARAVVGFTGDGRPVTCDDLRVAGAMTALLAEAIKPNLVQSIENHPVICHGFPFANVAHGNSSVLGALTALKLADFVVTESGFGADCGFAKLMEVVARQTPGLTVDCAVIVVTIRALKQHGGAFRLRPGMAYSTVKDAAEAENLPALEQGCRTNLAAHLNVVRTYGVPAVVAINRFTADTEAEIDLVRRLAVDLGAEAAVLHEAWAKGGEGAIDLARAVIRATERPPRNRFFYAAEASIEEKIDATATTLYGADGVDYAPLARERIKLYTRLGYHTLALNMAKTHLSLTDDSAVMGAPKGWRLQVRDIQACVGAGFLYPLAGVFPTMPGLPSRPAFMGVDVDLKTGKITGLF